MGHPEPPDPLLTTYGRHLDKVGRRNEKHSLLQASQKEKAKTVVVSFSECQICVAQGTETSIIKSSNSKGRILPGKGPI